MKPPIFVLSSGRSGSTLVQRILNSYPDITIWGEHRGFLRSVAEAYFSILEHPGNARYLFANRSDGVPFTGENLVEEKAADNWQAWMNWFSPADVTQLFRNFVLSFFRPALLGEGTIWGFKEIRYGANDRVIELLARLFPEAIFVFLVRNGYDTVSSQLMAWQPTGRLGSVRLERMVPGRRLLTYARHWVIQNRAFLRWHSSREIRSFVIAFEDIVRGERVPDPLLNAIGKSWGDEQQHILEMAEGRGSAFKDSDGVQQRSQSLGGLPLLAVHWIIGGLNAELGYPPLERLRWTRRFRLSAQPRRAQANGPAGEAVTVSSKEECLETPALSAKN
jgi:hypothetical protein